jgi:hypothetical protein
MSEPDIAFMTEMLSDLRLGSLVQSFSIDGQLRVPQEAELSLAEAVAALPNLEKVQGYLAADLKLSDRTLCSSSSHAVASRPHSSLGIIGATALLHRMLMLMQSRHTDVCDEKQSEQNQRCTAQVKTLECLNLSGLPLGRAGCHTLYSGLAAAKPWNLQYAEIKTCSLQSTRPGAPGCQALARLLATHPLASLQHLDLSANDMDDTSFADLSDSLFACSGVAQRA